MLPTKRQSLAGLILCVFLSLHYALGKTSRRHQNYYGALIGKLPEGSNGIKGTVYAADESTFFIKNFSYMGEAMLPTFWVGNTSIPSPDGKPLPYPEGSPSNSALSHYDNADIVLRLPPGTKVRDYDYFSIWSQRVSASLVFINIPKNLTIPMPRVLPEFSRLAHGLRSDNITILDSKTFYIPNLHYDGAGPDAYFWVGNGSEPDQYGMKIPNEVNKTTPLSGYEGVDIEIVLPDGLTVYDIDYLAVWCVQYKHNFGYVLIPKDLEVPPAVGQTKIAPAWWYAPTSSTAAPRLNNCIELLEGRVEVRWQLMGDDVQIKVSARMRDDQWVAFGLSGEEGKAEMIGSDIVVVGYNKDTKKFIAEDYYMSDYSQCDGAKGVCPDHRIGGKNDVVLIHGKRSHGITSVTYKRPIRTNELQFDKIIPSYETTVIAAIGLFNKNYEANAHLDSDRTSENIKINFIEQGMHKCTDALRKLPELPEIKPWPAMSIRGEESFTVRIGPTGGQRGYSRITGQPSWGIAWYINDKLIPEITVERGQNYTFYIEGGKDKTNPAEYHPFYITSSPEGGFSQLSDEQQRRQRLFAGVAYDQNNYPYPTAAGRYCEYKHKRTDQSAKTETFKEFFDTLRLDCEEGEPAKLVWFVEDDTPDTVYYQCYTHKNLGWKIKVVDQGYAAESDGGGSGSIAPSVILIAFILALAHLR